jgi:hypothetical protein
MGYCDHIRFQTKDHKGQHEKPVKGAININLIVTLCLKLREGLLT